MTVDVTVLATIFDFNGPTIETNIFVKRTARWTSVGRDRSRSAFINVDADSTFIVFVTFDTFAAVTDIDIDASSC